MKLRSLFLLIALNMSSLSSMAEDSSHSNSDTLYREVIRTVADVDFDAMAALYHTDAVLVTATYSKSISKVIPVWKSDGERHKNEGGIAFLNFRFSSRLISDSTSFDTGIFRYGTKDSHGVEKVVYINFQDLNVRKDGQWITLMERQLSEASVGEWNALAVWE